MSECHPPQASVPWMPALPGATAEWAVVPALAVDHFHPASSSHRPDTTVRVAHDGTHLGLCWRVEEEAVLARVDEVNGPTFRDSCVEAFLLPCNRSGPYLAIEINAVGIPFVAVIRDHRKRDDWFADAERIDPAIIARHLRVEASLAGPIPCERPGSCTWTLRVAIDVALFSLALGRSVALAGEWRGNFFKCADGTSRPHWGSWSPVGERLNFHQPDRFGRLSFSPGGV